MNRLLTAAIAVAAIAAFTSPQSRRLSHVRRALYASAVQQELFCSDADPSNLYKSSSGILINRCHYRQR